MLFKGLLGGFPSTNMDFGGISEEGKNALDQSIKDFRTKITDLISTFNDEAEISKAFKGTALTDAIHSMLGDVKDLLNSYVDLMQKDQNDLDTALENWKNADTSVKNLADSAAQDIRTEANNIKLD